jgi:hypothetical protein
MDDSQFLEELEPWFNSPEGKKQVDIFLSKQKLDQFKPEDQVHIWHPRLYTGLW